MKKHLAGNRYWTDYDVISTVVNFFESQEVSFYITSVPALQNRCKKCMDCTGDFVEKQITFVQIQALHVS